MGTEQGIFILEDAYGNRHGEPRGVPTNRDEESIPRITERLLLPTVSGEAMTDEELIDNLGGAAHPKSVFLKDLTTMI